MNATTLKIIGMVSMTIDHIGFFLFPQNTVLRVSGRLAYPIFAYMIAEGCCHTRNKTRYFCTMFGIACAGSIVTYVTERNLYQSIFTTFSCSVILIFTLEKVIRSTERVGKNLWCCVAAAITFLYFVIFYLRPITGFETDYGFWGIITPVLVWLGHTKAEKLMGLTIGLCLVSAEFGVIQLCSLIAVIVLWHYNGERGKHSLKWLFYGYYPLHIAVLYEIAQFVSGFAF